MTDDELRVKIAAGVKVGLLTAILPTRQGKSRKWYWIFRCDCGGQKEILASSVSSGHTRSCGCYRDEHRTRRSRKHGMFGTPTYNCWSSMMARCGNPKAQSFPHYGGRGIKVCGRWRLFVNFFADMGTKPSSVMSIERIDNNGDYEPGNCRWADAVEQHNNTRVNVRLTYNGETQTIAQWARVFGLRTDTLWRRLRSAWDFDRAFKTPV